MVSSNVHLVAAEEISMNTKYEQIKGHTRQIQRKPPQRGVLEIAAEVLKAIADHGEDGVNALIFQTNTTHPILKDFLRDLENGGYLTSKISGIKLARGGRQLFYLTPEGYRLLKDYLKVKNALFRALWPGEEIR